MLDKQKILAVLEEYAKLYEDTPFDRFLRSRGSGLDKGYHQWVRRWKKRDAELMAALFAAARDLAAPSAERGDTELADRLLRLADMLETERAVGRSACDGSGEVFLRDVRVATTALPSGGKGRLVQELVRAHIAEQINNGRKIAQFTRDGIARAIGKSGSAVSGTSAWKKLAIRKRALTKPAQDQAFAEAEQGNFDPLEALQRKEEDYHEYRS